ncbi:hypothetical protein [Streptomyces sp. NPDC093109]|uniref:hypothetical protein n=1 Tax=Streptomyces sp. NPDC093109 TaxID=3154977 RepID=UPI0034501D04
MRKLVRTGGAAAGAVALALALAACGGSGDDSGDSGKDKAGASASGGTGGSGSGSSSGSGSGSDAASVDGSWAAITDGKPVAMSVKDAQITLAVEGHACTGAVKEMSGTSMLSLVCADGYKDRTMGTIESNDGTNLVVAWSGGPKDTFMNADKGALPSGLPTELPEGFPTALPGS